VSAPKNVPVAVDMVEVVDAVEEEVAAVSSSLFICFELRYLFF
jgi:hypothetical protein